MTVYTITTANWDTPSFWSSINESGSDHTLDFSELPSNFEVITHPSGIITITDGTTGFTIGEAGVGGQDANFGGGTLLDFFTTLIGSQGNDDLTGTGGHDTIVGNDGNDTIDGGVGNDTIYGDDSISFVYNTPAGGLYSYNAETGETTQLTSGLQEYGDIATTPDGKIYGVVLDALSSTNAGIYEINPVTGAETLVYDLPDNFEFYAGLGSDPDGNLYISDTDTGVITRIEPDGFGGFTQPRVVQISSDPITDIAFLDEDTAWTVDGLNAILAYDVEETGRFTNPTSLGSIPGGGNPTGISLAENGRIYVTNEDGDVFSTDPTSLPLTWTAEAGTGQTIFGIAPVPTGLSSPGDDTIDGGTGDDTIIAGDGSDTIQLSDDFGDDVVFGGEDPDGLDVDVIDASGVTTSGVTVNVTSEDGKVIQGADSADFSDIESFVLTDQDDTFNAFGTSDVTVDAGGGDDEIREGNGHNVIDGGDGSDTINVGYGTSTIIGGEDGDGSDVDTLSASDANDGITVTFDGTEQGTYTDNSDSDSGTFTQIEAVEGSGQADTINAAADASSGLTLSGLGGSDEITGGSGNDTITDFNVGNSGALGDGDTTNNDFINLAPFYDTLAELKDDHADDGILNQSNAGNTVHGQTVDYSDNTSFDTNGTVDDEGVAFAGLPADGSGFTSENTGVVCFTLGTLIATPQGEVPIETLRPGGLVLTRDNGPKPLVWIGQRYVSGAELAREEKLRPIEIKPSLIKSDSSLIVSRQHGVLLSVDGQETLVRAVHLAKLPDTGARIMHGCKSVTYIHLMFEEHQIIFAGGAPSESFHPGPQALSALNTEARAELCDLFPEVPTSTCRDFTRYSQVRHSCLSAA